MASVVVVVAGTVVVVDLTVVVVVAGTVVVVDLPVVVVVAGTVVVVDLAVVVEVAGTVVVVDLTVVVVAGAVVVGADSLQVGTVIVLASMVTAPFREFTSGDCRTSVERDRCQRKGGADEARVRPERFRAPNDPEDVAGLGTVFEHDIARRRGDERRCRIEDEDSGRRRPAR